MGDFVSLIFPRACLACGNSLYKHEGSICTICLHQLPKTGFHRQADNMVARHFWGKTPIEAGASLFYFEKGGRVQNLLHQFKYKKFTAVGTELGKLYGKDLKDAEPYNTCDYIIPVPLHKSKLRKRGFNQSAVFASGLSGEMGIPTLFDNLIRKVATDTQTKKRAFERYENTSSIFEITNAEELKGKHILLVDDVITTGSTLEACVAALQQADGVKVSIATIACAK